MPFAWIFSARYLHHEWKDQGVNEILVYALRNDQEIELLKPVIEASYRFAIREHLTD